MLFFGHIGNTSGLVRLYQKAITARKPAGETDTVLRTDATGEADPPSSNIQRAIGFIDYRMVLIGSLLPDIIDKPLWWLLGKTRLDWAGRGYAHTFLFNFILFIGGLVLAFRRKKNWLLIIASCSFLHLVFDQIWLMPTTLWWPFAGAIKPEETAGWFSGMWEGLLSNPYIYISETLGFLITLYFGLRLLMRRRILHFLKTGDIA